MSRRVFNGDTLVADYLEELSQRLEPLRWSQRNELLADVARHINEERAHLPDQDAATVLTMLERLGDPADIAAEAGGTPASTSGHAPSSAPAHDATTGRTELWAIWLLLLGGFLCVAGWLVGLFLLWQSRLWRLRDKVIGTLLLPGGLAAPVLLLVWPFSVVARDATGVGRVYPTLITTPTTATATALSPPPTGAPAATVGSNVGTHLGSSASNHGILVSSSAGGWIPNVLFTVAVVVLLLVPVATALYLNWRRRAALRARGAVP